MKIFHAVLKTLRFFSRPVLYIVWILGPTSGILPLLVGLRRGLRGSGRQYLRFAD